MEEIKQHDTCRMREGWCRDCESTEYKDGCLVSPTVNELLEQLKQLKEENAALTKENERLAELMTTEHCPSLPTCYAESKELDRLREREKELEEYNSNLEKTLRICLTVQPHTKSVDTMKAMVKTLLDQSALSKLNSKVV